MTLMQTPSKAGDLDGQGRRSRDAEAVWVMPLQAMGCHRPPAPPEPRGPGDKRPLVASRAPPPTLQTDSLVLDFRPPREGRVYSVPLVETGSAAWGSQDPLLCRLCARTHAVLCRHESPREPARTPARSQARHGWEGMGAGSSQVRTGRLYEGLRLVGSKPGGRHRAAHAHL